MIQASWGMGKAIHAANAPPIELSAENPLCRFKTLGYSMLPSHKSEDGRMGAVIKKKAADLEPQKAQIEAALNQVLGSKPNVKVTVESIKPLNGDASSEVVFTVQESTQPAAAAPLMGAPVQPPQQPAQTRKVPCHELQTFFSAPAQVQNLQRQGIESVTPKQAFTQAQIDQYLENPPQGIDPRLWKQAQLANPDPKKLIPVPMTGFKSLQNRIACQNNQLKIHQGMINKSADRLSDLEKRYQVKN